MYLVCKFDLIPIDLGWFCIFHLGNFISMLLNMFNLDFSCFLVSAMRIHNVFFAETRFVRKANHSLWLLFYFTYRRSGNGQFVGMCNFSEATFPLFLMLFVIWKFGIHVWTLVFFDSMLLQWANIVWGEGEGGCP